MGIQMRWEELNKTFMMISYQNNFLVSMIGIQIKQKQLLTNKFILIFNNIRCIYQNNVWFDNGLRQVLVDNGIFFP